MPAPPLANSLEGQPTGTVVSAANSGAGSGDAFQVATIAAGHTLAFSDEQSAHGNNSLKVQSPAASPGSTRVDWTGLGSITATIWIRMYVYRPYYPSGPYLCIGVRDNAGALSCQLFIAATGVLNVQNAAGSSATLGPTTGSIARGQWVRIEWSVLSSTTVGASTVRYYNDPESTTFTEEKIHTSNQAFLANSDQLRFGMITNALASDTCYFDEIAVSTSTWIGPSSNPVEARTGYVPRAMPLA